MTDKRLPYMLGIIKWTCKISFLIWTSRILTGMGITNNWISVALAVILSYLIFIQYIGKKIEKLYGVENLIDNTRGFKIFVVSVILIKGFIMVYILKLISLQYLLLTMAFVMGIVYGMIYLTKLLKKRQMPLQRRGLFDG